MKKKLISILPEVLLLMYILLCSFILMWFEGVKEQISAYSGYTVTPTFTQTVDVMAGRTSVLDYAIQPEMPYMPGAYNFDWDDPSLSYHGTSTNKEETPEEFEWSVSEEYDYIKLQKGWTIKPITYVCAVTSFDPYANGGNGVGSDGVKARYNQTCSMKDVPYGTKIWLKGSGTAIVFVVTDHCTANNTIVLHQHDNLGELDGEYEIYKCSPPTTNYLPDTPSVADFDQWYQEWKDESQAEIEEYNAWVDLKTKYVNS